MAVVLRHVPSYGAMGSYIALEEVVEGKTEVVANRLFGQSEVYLEEDLKQSEKFSKGYVIILTISAVTFLGSTLYYIVQPDKKTLYLWVGSALVLFVIASGAVPASEYGNKAKAYLKGCEIFKALYRSFEEFKKNPEEHAVSQLLIQFRKFCNEQWISHGASLMKSEDQLIFKSVGSLLFMDNLVQILKKSGSRSSLVSKWDLELEAMGNRSQHYPATDLWEKLGVTAPSRDSCQVPLPWAEKIFVMDKVKEVFGHVLQKSIQSKII